MFTSCNVISVTESRIRYAQHEGYMGELGSTYKILVREPEKKRNNFGGQDIHGRIILKLILMK